MCFMLERRRQKHGGECFLRHFVRLGFVRSPIFAVMDRWILYWRMVLGCLGRYPKCSPNSYLCWRIRWKSGRLLWFIGTFSRFPGLSVVFLDAIMMYVLSSWIFFQGHSVVCFGGLRLCQKDECVILVDNLGMIFMFGDGRKHWWWETAVCDSFRWC